MKRKIMSAILIGILTCSTVMLTACDSSSSKNQPTTVEATTKAQPKTEKTTKTLNDKKEEAKSYIKYHPSSLKSDLKSAFNLSEISDVYVGEIEYVDYTDKKDGTEELEFEARGKVKGYEQTYGDYTSKKFKVKVTVTMENGKAKSVWYSNISEVK